MTRQQGAFFRSWNAAALANKTVRIANNGQGRERRCDRLRNPLTPEPGRARLQDRAAYWTLDGKPVDLAAIKQNDRFVLL